MIKRRIKIFISIIVFFALLICTGKWLRYIVTDDTDSYTRITYHEMYEQDNIDVLFVGSSHCYRSFIPEILDDELRQNTFNVGSSGQLMDGSLMLIKEAVKNNDIKHIYLEVYFGCCSDIKKDRVQPVSTYIISDYLRPSVDKYMYLLSATNSEHYANSFIIARRNWINIFDLDYIKDVIIKKGTDAYKNYEYVTVGGGTEWYAGKGFVANNSIIDGWNYFSTAGREPININNISNDWRMDINCIIDFCEKNNVPLTLIGAPMSNFLMAGIGNYDEYVDCIKEIIEDKNIDYYDFNLCREDYFPNTSELFCDADHLNCYGAEVFSHAFAKLVNGEVEPEEMFYESYEQKMESIPTTVFGVSYKDETLEDGTILRNCTIISNGKDKLEYRIVIEPLDDKPYILRDYSYDEDFSISPDEKGTCVINYRLVENIENSDEIRLTMPD